MATHLAETQAEWMVADLLDRFGPILFRRMRQAPPPGGATERDVVDIHERERRLYELVDGVFLQKAMGVQESLLALWIARLLGTFVDEHDLGIVLGSNGMARFAPGLVRIPDVRFNCSRFPVIPHGRNPAGRGG